MNVYIENLLKKANSLAATGKDPAFREELLYDEVLSNRLPFSGQSTVITAGWGLNCFADSVAILASNWTTGRLTVSFPLPPTSYTVNITSQGRNSIFRLPGLRMISGIELSLSSVTPLEIGLLFAGAAVELPLFNAGFKYRLNVNGKGERTKYGIVYGLRRPSLRSFDVTFSDIDGARLSVFEDYIDTVQFFRPHIVEPYDSGHFQPLYATLVNGGEFTKMKGAGFRWNTALGYMEAK